MPKICSIEGCEAPVGKHGAKGMCHRHYYRWKKWGDPQTRKKSILGGKCYKNTPTHNSYSGMKQRCQNRRHPSYDNYGSLGITVCDRWLGVDGFRHFLEDMGERPEGMTLDRIDPDGDYCPENCRWSTPRVQAGNKRTHRGGSDTVGVWKYNDKYWAATLGVGGKTFFKYAKTEEEAIKLRKELELAHPEIS